jgi:hypothetical protein
MSSSKTILRLALLLAGSLVIAGTVPAQDTQEPQQPVPVMKPKPAARGLSFINDPNATVENSETYSDWRADTGPATGMQVQSLGSPELAHSYWVGGFAYGSTIQSRPLGQQTTTNGTTGWYANNYVGGNASLVENWGHSQFAVSDSGGGFFSTNSEINNGWYQQLAAAYNLTFARTQIQLFDNFSYIPDSQFGFAGGTNLALPGIGGTLGPSIPGLGAAILPNQSIYAAVGPRYSNAFAAQTTYQFSRKSSMTLGGSYGLLDFTEPGNVDNYMVIGSAGYNFALNDTDSVGVLYRFSSYHYSGEPQALGNHVANFVYVKRMTRQLVLNLFGGPQITTYRVPIGSETVNIGASAGVTFKRLFERGNIGLNYYHGLSGGGGVLEGAFTDEVGLALDRQLTRTWSARCNFGYSRNSALGSLANTQTQLYNDFFVTGGVSRPFGRNVDFSAAYTARIEQANHATCNGLNCNTSYTQNMVSVSLQWHAGPLVLP